MKLSHIWSAALFLLLGVVATMAAPAQNLQSITFNGIGTFPKNIPNGNLLQGTQGPFYGTTSGPPSNGTAYKLTTGLKPIVAFVQDQGKVGQTSGILGQGFTGTTGVSFNGVPAKFTVKSDTYLTATVPAGAATGPVMVNTPAGTLTSNVDFFVLQ